MQADSRNRCRTADTRVDCLITFRVGQRLMNVRRQRHLAQLLNELAHSKKRCCCWIETDDPSPHLRALSYCGVEFQVGEPFMTKNKLVPFMQTPPGTHQRLQIILPEVSSFRQ